MQLPLAKRESDVQAIVSLPATKTLIKDFFTIFGNNPDTLIILDSKG